MVQGDQNHLILEKYTTNDLRIIVKPKKRRIKRGAKFYPHCRNKFVHIFFMNKIINFHAIFVITIYFLSKLIYCK